MGFARIYAKSSFLIAAVIIIASAVEIYWPSLPMVSMVSSVLQILWLVVSLGCLLVISGTGLPLEAPLSFVGYNIAFNALNVAMSFSFGRDNAASWLVDLRRDARPLDVGEIIFAVIFVGLNLRLLHYKHKTAMPLSPVQQTDDVN